MQIRGTFLAPLIRGLRVEEACDKAGPDVRWTRLQ